MKPRSAAEEIIEYYNSEPIDEPADPLAGKYGGCNQRMVNAILKWLEENPKASIKPKDDEITEGERNGL